MIFTSVVNSSTEFFNPSNVTCRKNVKHYQHIIYCIFSYTCTIITKKRQLHAIAYSTSTKTSLLQSPCYFLKDFNSKVTFSFIESYLYKECEPTRERVFIFSYIRVISLYVVNKMIIKMDLTKSQ